MTTITERMRPAESIAPASRCYGCHLPRSGMTQFRVWDGAAQAYVPHWLCPACHERRKQAVVARLRKAT